MIRDGGPMRPSVYTRLMLAVAVFSATAWGCSPDTAQRPSESEPIPLTLAVSRECLCATVFIAEATGAFADAGLDVTIIEYPSSQPCMEALIRGEVDAATCADTPIVFAALDDGRFDIIATLGSSDNDIRIVARSDRDISEPGDLDGRCIATAPRTAAHAFLATFLARHGVSTSDVNMCLEPFDAVVAGLEDGTYGAAALREPFVSDAIAALGDDVVVFEEPGLYLKTMNLCVDTDLDADARERLLGALVASELGAGDEFCDQAVAIVAERLGQEKAAACEAICEGEYRIRLDQALILALEDQARWAIASGSTTSDRTPDFLGRFDLSPLDRIDPARIQVIR